MRYEDGWWLPEAPEQKRHPIRGQLKSDINVIDKALARTKGRECVIQAGCRLGLWPKTLAQHFGVVYTFEPEQKNYDCSVKNLEGIENINLYHAALGQNQRNAFIELNDIGWGSSHQVVDTPCSGTETQPIAVMTIDVMGLAPDLIMLDIEGYELYALIGARHTLVKYKPTIVIEQNDAMKRYGVRKPAVLRFLHELGYVVVDRQYKDLILTWREPEPVCTATE